MCNVLIILLIISINATGSCIEHEFIQMHRELRTTYYIQHMSTDRLRPMSASITGMYEGPSGLESYYYCNPCMVRDMRYRGFSETEYPYYVREDGVQMLGEYVIVAANIDIYPFGSIVDTSLGKGIVCDTGGSFVTDKDGDYLYRALDIGTLWN